MRCRAPKIDIDAGGRFLLSQTSRTSCLVEEVNVQTASDVSEKVPAAYQLSDDQLARYEKDGFIIIRGLLNKGELDPY